MINHNPNVNRKSVYKSINATVFPKVMKAKKKKFFQQRRVSAKKSVATIIIENKQKTQKACSYLGDQY